MATCHKTAWEPMCKDHMTDHSVTTKEKVEETLNEQSSTKHLVLPVPWLAGLVTSKSSS